MPENMNENSPHEADVTQLVGVADGLIYGYILDGQGGGRLLSRDAIAGWEPGQGTRWLHFNYESEQAQQWLYNESQLPPLAVEALLAENTRPRAAVMGGGLFIALRGANLTPGAEPDDMVSIRIWIDAHQVITTRKRSLYSVGDIVRMIEDRVGPANGAEFVVELADRLVWRLSDVVDQFEDRVAEMEEQILSSGGILDRHELATMRRQIIILRRYLAPQKEAFHKLISEKSDLLTDMDRMQLRESGDRLLRHIEDLDAVRERAALAQEELLHRSSQQTNTRMYMLSVVAATFLPLTFVTGLLGINVAGIPGAESPYAFLIVVCLLLGLVTAQLFYFRHRKWL
jgi:zinc transporter